MHIEIDPADTEIVAYPAGYIDAVRYRGVLVSLRPGPWATQETLSPDSMDETIEQLACLDRSIAARALAWKAAEISAHKRVVFLSRVQWEGRDELEVDPARFRFVPDGDYVRKVYYGGHFILIQPYNDPTCTWEQQRALDGAALLLQHEWERLSAHQRLQVLSEIEGRTDAE